MSVTPQVQKFSACGDEVQSPCNGICTLGPEDFCIGCLRSADEIGNWQNYSSHRRKLIMKELPDRLQTLFGR